MQGAIRIAFRGELGAGRKDIPKQWGSTGKKKPKLSQGTKTGNIVGTGVLVENSNTIYLQINKLKKCLMLEKKTFKQSKKIISPDHHCQEQYFLKG